MPLPLVGKIVGGLLQSDPATATAFDANAACGVPTDPLLAKHRVEPRVPPWGR
jgi:hypothetical protein